MYLDAKHNNFDFMRLLLASTVFIVNAEVLSRTDSSLNISRYLDASMAVDAFFVISGFLIFMSYDNSSTLKDYYIKRARRIYPAYVAVVIVCSFLFFFISSHSFNDYITLEWAKYVFFNLLFLNFVQPSLPGVFDNNYLNAVNGALWTLQIEATFYLVVPIISLVLLKTNKIFLMSLFYLLSILYAMCMGYLAESYGNDLLINIGKLLPGQLAFFISGAFLYYYHGHLRKYSVIYFLVGASGFVVAKSLEFSPLYPISLAILVIYFSTLLKYLGNWGKYGDFSYGIYIWHFPIIQLFVHLQFFDSSPYIGLLSSALIISSVAYLSWRFIEKPCLKRNSYYRIAEKHFIREDLKPIKMT